LTTVTPGRIERNDQVVPELAGLVQIGHEEEEEEGDAERDAPNRTMLPPAQRVERDPESCRSGSLTASQIINQENNASQGGTDAGDVGEKYSGRRT
jgi:hypothetical protein